MRWLTQNRVGAGAAGPSASSAGASTARASSAGANRVGANIKKNRQNIKNALLGGREQDVDIEKQNY